MIILSQISYCLVGNIILLDILRTHMLRVRKNKMNFLRRYFVY